MDTTGISEIIDVESFAKGGANTEVSYMYRDADNYKVSRRVVLGGTITVAKAMEIVRALDEGQYFVPSEIGLEDIQGGFLAGADWNEQVDHPFHELTGIALTDDEPFGDMTAAKFHERFVMADWKAGEARVMAEHA